MINRCFKRTCFQVNPLSLEVITKQAHCNGLAFHEGINSKSRGASSPGVHHVKINDISPCGTPVSNGNEGIHKWRKSKVSGLSSQDYNQKECFYLRDRCPTDGRLLAKND